MNEKNITYLNGGKYLYQIKLKVAVLACVKKVKQRDIKLIPK